MAKKSEKAAEREAERKDMETEFKMGTMEKVLLMGDLSPLTERERVEYVTKVCEAVGLNPITQPFQYHKLDGRLVLYATRSASDQLCYTRNLSVTIVEESIVAESILKVKARCEAPGGRVVEDIGTKMIKGISGKELANAYMVAVTKAKRRAILSACGLAYLDETEIADVSITDRAAGGVAQLENKHAAQVTHQPSDGVGRPVRQRDLEHAPTGGNGGVTEGGEPPPDKAGRVARGEQVREAHGGEAREASPTSTDTGADQGGDGDVSRETVTTDDRQGEQAGSSSNTRLFAPPDDVLTSLAGGRWYPWFKWACDVLDNLTGKQLADFKEHYAVEIEMVHEYGGLHWRNLDAALKKAATDAAKN